MKPGVYFKPETLEMISVDKHEYLLSMVYVTANFSNWGEVTVLGNRQKVKRLFSKFEQLKPLDNPSVGKV